MIQEARVGITGKIMGVQSGNFRRMGKLWISRRMACVWVGV